ncbi:histidine phosphatase family protein [Qipengyuania flava]|nr:histidine phosphatase family protein [Qipengyuania flava]
MSPNVEIYLIRHGETLWNHQGRYQGSLDSPLTEQGIEQARSCGAALAKCEVAVDHWHVSPLGRAQQTSAIVRSFGNYPRARSTERLAEVTAGSWDGLTQEEIDAEWPEVLDGSTQFDWYFRAPDGESYDEAMARVEAWMLGLSGIVVAVSHGLVSRLIRGNYLGLTKDQTLSLSVQQGVVWRMRNGSIEMIDDS